MDEQKLDPLFYNPDIIIDTVVLSERVRNYLNYNQIRWGRFASLVLGIGQARLSMLLGHPKPWGQLKLRVKTYYQRMQEWMDTWATYGNNPHATIRKKKIKRKIKPAKKVKQSPRHRTLFQWDASRAEKENQKAIEEIISLNQAGALPSKGSDLLPEQMALDGYLQSAAADGSLSSSGYRGSIYSSFSTTSASTSSTLNQGSAMEPQFWSLEDENNTAEMEEEDDQGELDGIEFVMDDEIEDQEHFHAVDLDINSVHLPDLADIDLDELNDTTYIFPKYPGLTLTRLPHEQPENPLGHQEFSKTLLELESSSRNIPEQESVKNKFQETSISIKEKDVLSRNNLDQDFLLHLLEQGSAGNILDLEIARSILTTPSFKNLLEAEFSIHSLESNIVRHEISSNLLEETSRNTSSLNPIEQEVLGNMLEGETPRISAGPDSAMESPRNHLDIMGNSLLDGGHNDGLIRSGDLSDMMEPIPQINQSRGMDKYLCDIEVRNMPSLEWEDSGCTIDSIHIADTDTAAYSVLVAGSSSFADSSYEAGSSYEAK